MEVEQRTGTILLWGNSERVGVVQLGADSLNTLLRHFNTPAHKTSEEELFTRVCSNKWKGNDFKLKDMKFTLHKRKKFFRRRVVKHWTRLPRDERDASSVEAFKDNLDWTLSNLSYRCPCSLQEALIKWSLKVSSNPIYSIIPQSIFVSPIQIWTAASVHWHLPLLQTHKLLFFSQTKVLLYK